MVSPLPNVALVAARSVMRWPRAGCVLPRPVRCALLAWGCLTNGTLRTTRLPCPRTQSVDGAIMRYTSASAARTIGNALCVSLAQKRGCMTSLSRPCVSARDFAGGVGDDALTIVGREHLTAGRISDCDHQR